MHNIRIMFNRRPCIESIDKEANVLALSLCFESPKFQIWDCTCREIRGTPAGSRRVSREPRIIHGKLFEGRQNFIWDFGS